MTSAPAPLTGPSLLHFVTKQFISNGGSATSVACNCSERGPVGFLKPRAMNDPICNETRCVSPVCVSLSREIIQKDSHYGITLYGTVYRLFEHPIEVYGLILSEN